MQIHADEAEQLQALKDFWKKHGNFIVLTIVLITVVSMGYYYWHQWHYRRTSQASILYEQLLEGVSIQNDAATNDIDTQAVARQLMEEFPNTPYATMAALIAARQATETKHLNEALNKLRWAEQKTQDVALKALIKLRIARALLAMKKPREALSTLEHVTSKAFSPAVQLIRGSILASMNEKAKAQLSYEQALSSISKREPMHNIVQMQYLNMLSEQQNTGV